jgi:conjugal transfer mating pair stabilization protein TraN
MTQLQALDFSRMDLSEFYAEIAPTLPDVSNIRSRAQQKINSYYNP